MQFERCVTCRLAAYPGIFFYDPRQPLAIHNPSNIVALPEKKKDEFTQMVTPVFYGEP